MATMTISSEEAAAVSEPCEIADYQLLGAVGKGAFGEVYVARNRHHGEFCAVKLVFAERSEVELEAIRNYKNVVRDNEYLVQIEHVGKTIDGQYYYVMPLADDANGPAVLRAPDQYKPLTLKRYRAALGPLSLDEALVIAERLLLGLSQLHSRRMVHCDVKPANILRVAGRWRLGDIGLLSPRELLSAYRGTRWFLPPDDRPGYKSDIYALGKTLLLLATDSEPPDTTSDSDPLVAFTTGVLDISSEDDRKSRFRDIVLAACNIDPDKRPTAKALQQAVAKLLRKTSVVLNIVGIDYDSLDEEQLVRELVARLGLCVLSSRKKRGSVLVELELTLEQAKLLLSAAKEGKLADLGVDNGWLVEQQKRAPPQTHGLQHSFPKKSKHAISKKENSTMFKRISCPTCSYKFNVPEGDMLKRHVCPNCQSPFLAGKSVPESSGAAPVSGGAPAGSSLVAQAGAQAQAGPPSGGDPALNKTMIVEDGPPIKFNCPRCKKPLEIPASEGGSKRPCPECGQRLKVPDAPKAPAGAPGIDKTMLAGDEAIAAGQATGPHANIAADPGLAKTMLGSTGPPIKFNCPRCQKPMEAPASDIGAKKACPSCSQRVMVPAASASGPGAPPSGAGSTHMPGSTTQIGDISLPFKIPKAALIAAAIAVGLLLLCVLPQLILPSHNASAFAEAQNKLADMQKKVEETKREQERVKAEIRRDEENKRENDRRQKQLDELADQVKGSATSVKRQKLDLQSQYDRLSDIVIESDRKAAKLKLDRQKAELAREEQRIKDQQDQIARNQQNERDEARRREQEHQSRLDQQKQLQLQMQQQQHAMTLATINASRPSYYPWHYGRYWPW